MRIQLPEYYSLEENAAEVILYYKDQYIRSFFKDHTAMEPLSDPLETRILDYIAQHKLLIEVKHSVYDPNLHVNTNAKGVAGVYDKALMNKYAATATINKPDPLTYDNLVKAQEALKKSHAGIKPFIVNHSMFRGKSVVLPENYRIVEDPTSIFHGIKIYYLDRHIKTFENDVMQKEIHEFVKEHKNGT